MLHILQNAEVLSHDSLSVYAVDFPPLEFEIITCRAPHGPVSFWHFPFPLVGLILGCFVKILHQIWKKKTKQKGWRGKAIALRKQLRKSAFIWNVIHLCNGSLCSSLLLPRRAKSVRHMKPLATTESSCKNRGKEHQKVGFNYTVKCEKSPRPSRVSEGRRLKWKQFKKSG